MPIKSYLVHPRKGKKSYLTRILANMEFCEVLPAENEDVLILVTDTDSKQEEELLKEKLEKLDGIKLMAMVSGFHTQKEE